MGTQFSFFYDIAVILIAVVCVIVGYRKGFMKTAVATGVYLAALALSWAASIYISGVLYDNYFKEKNYQIVSEYLQTNNFADKISSELGANGVDVTADEIKQAASGNNSDILYSVMQQNGYTGTKEQFDSTVSESMSEIMDSMLLNTSLPYSDAISKNVVLSNPDELTSLLKDVTDGNYEDTVNKICDVYLKDLEITVIRILVTGLLTTVIMMIANIVITKKRSGIIGREQGSVDSFFGGVFGVFSSLFYIYIFASIVHMFVATGKEQMMFFNDAVIDKTYIFQYFYRVLLHI